MSEVVLRQQLWAPKTQDELACWRGISVLSFCPYSHCNIFLFSVFFSCSFPSSPYSFISEQAMAIQTQTTPLAALHARAEVVSESDLTSAQALSHISRKKQAAVLCSAFVAIALTIGYNQCYGVFQEYYLSSSQDVLIPSPASQVSQPTALLAFVGSLCYGLTWAGGILVNPVIARIEHRYWPQPRPRLDYGAAGFCACWHRGQSPFQGYSWCPLCSRWPPSAVLYGSSCLHRVFWLALECHSCTSRF